MTESRAGDDESYEGEGVTEEVDVELVVPGRQEVRRVARVVREEVPAVGVVGLGAPDAVQSTEAGSIF